jgi:hypothetical protein
MRRPTGALIVQLLSVAFFVVQPVTGIAQPHLSFVEDGIEVTVPNTCNSVVFVQVPTHPDFFLGRIAGSNGGRCPEVREQLSGIALFKMDWNTHTLKLDKQVFRPLTPISGATVHHAFDPSIVSFNGELWVSFECATGYTSACVGPFDWATASIDPRRTTAPVLGIDADQKSGFFYSASVPNLCVFEDRLYVYWSAIKVRLADKTPENITIRGMELAREPSGLRRMWGRGSGASPVASHDPAHNTEVVGLDLGDAYSNQAVDLKGVYATQSQIYLIAALGGKGLDGSGTCVNATGTSYRCWRMQIFRSSAPLGTDIFNMHPLVSPELPINPAAYQRPFIAPDGTLRILGQFYTPRVTDPGRHNRIINFHNGGKLTSYPFPLDQLKFKE